MTIKQILVSTGAAIALTLSGSAISAEPASQGVFQSKPMDGGTPAQVTNPDPSAQAQEKTEAMLKEEAAEIYDGKPMDGGTPAQVTNPDPSAQAQEKTETMLKGEEKELQGYK